MSDDSAIRQGSQTDSGSTSAGRTLLWIRLWLLVFVFGLVLSGATALPLAREVNVLYRALHHFGIFSGPVHEWIQAVLAALLDTGARYPFMLYGTDWLAFGHFAIALAFLGPLRDPRRNIWVIEFGIGASLLVIPYALCFGRYRGIPWWWQLIDCSFGLLALIPLAAAYRLTKRLERNS